MRSSLLPITLLAVSFVATAQAQNAQRDDQRTQTQPRPAQQDQQRAGQRPTDAQGRASATTETRSTATNTADAAAGAATGADQQIAALIFGESHNEIELAKFVQQKLQGEEAKQFAAKMIREHQPGCDAMKRLAGNLASHEAGAAGAEHAQPAGAAPRREGAAATTTETRTTTAGATEARREGATPGATAEVRTGAATGAEPRRDASGTAAAVEQRTGKTTVTESRTEEPRVSGRSTSVTATTGSRGGLDWVSIHKEFGQQCLESTKKEFSAKSGAELDKCFMVHQAMAHQKMVDQLEVLQNHASGELKQKIGEEIQLAQGHLQEAKQIVEQFKDKPTERVSRNPKQ